jgi:CheY-like chemotaxis protein
MAYSSAACDEAVQRRHHPAAACAEVRDAGSEPAPGQPVHGRRSSRATFIDALRRRHLALSHRLSAALLVNGPRRSVFAKEDLAVCRALCLLPARLLLVGAHVGKTRPALEYLNRWDVDTRVADSGPEAMHLAGAECFDLILCDASRSTLDAVYVASRVRDIELGRMAQVGGTPRVALVARTPGNRPAFEAVLLPAGFDEVLKKQAEHRAVMECLLRWSRGRFRDGQQHWDDAQVENRDLPAWA